MVFRLIPPGWNDNATSITKPFYFAVWPMTTQQYALIMGGAGTSETKTGLSYNDIRGSVLGSKYPEHQQVDAGSIVGKLRLRTGITFDLSTQWQWMAAAKAYTNIAPTSPNAFGIYCLGSYPEWCVNWYSSGTQYGSDLTGPLSGKGGARSYCGLTFITSGSGITYGTGEMWLYRARSSASSDPSWMYDFDYTVPSFSGVEYRYTLNQYRSYQELCTGKYTDTRIRPACRLVALPNCK